MSPQLIVVIDGLVRKDVLLRWQYMLGSSDDGFASAEIGHFW